MMCEQLGTEPDPKRLPPSTSDLPEEVQLALTIFSYMPDRWDGFSGAYFGKDWSCADFFLELIKVEKKKKIIILFLSRIQELYSEKINKDQEERRKKEERKAKAGGKQYAHNVQG